MLNIFAFGSGYIEFGIMQAIAQMFSGNQMNVLFASMMALGGVMVAVMTLISGYDRPGSHLTLAKYLMGVMFVYGVLIVPRVTVHIEDTVINTQSNAYVVTGVPFGIGGIMSLFSNIQMDLTQLVETNFSTPQSIDLTNAGMGLSLTSENLADNITISDPYLKRDFTQFTYNCIMPGMSAAGGIDMFDLDMAGAATDNSPATYNSNTAASFWSVVSAYTSGAGANEITTWYSGNGTVTGAASGGDYPQGLTTTCGQETTWMNTAMEYYIDNDAGPALAGSLGETWSQFSTEYGQINSSVYNMSNGATSQFEQMALTNEFSNAVIDSAKLAGLNANSVAYGTAMAQENMNNSFLISGVMASQYLPVAYGIISSLVMAFSVILLLLIFLPTGVNYLKMYFELLMFITVWPPLMAIYNYITDLIIQHNSVSLAGEGFSILTAHSYSTFTSSYLGWVGYMSWSIPMLAYALVTGSTYAMVATLSSVDSAGKSSASAGAKVASTGDLSLGNDSLNNYSANKHNSAVQDVTGVMPRTNYAGFKKMEQSGNNDKLTDTGTGAYAEVGRGSSTVEAAGSNMIDGSINKANVTSASSNLTSAKSNAKSDQQSLNSSYGQTVASYNGLSSTDKTAVNKDWNLSNQKSVSNAMAYAGIDKGSITSSNVAALSAYMKTHAGLNVLGDGGDAGVEFHLEHRFGMSKEQAKSFTTKYQADQMQSLNNSLSKSHSTSIGKDSGFKNSVSDSVTKQNTYVSAESKVKSAQTALTAAKSTTSQMTAKALPGFLTQYNKKHGLTGQNATYADVHLENQMGAGNKKDLKSFRDYLNNKSGIAKTQQKISAGSKDISTKKINPQTPAAAFNKNKPAAAGDYTLYSMISTPTKAQRNATINKNIQNAAKLKRKALDEGSLTHKLGLKKPVNYALKPPTERHEAETITGTHGIDKMSAKTRSGIKGNIIVNKSGNEEFQYKNSKGKEVKYIINTSNGSEPGSQPTFTSSNGVVHTLKDEHFGSSSPAAKKGQTVNFIQADPSSPSAMKTISKVGLTSGSSGAGNSPRNAQGKSFTFEGRKVSPPAQTQSPTMVKGGGFTAEKNSGGGYKPYVMGTWVGGNPSGKSNTVSSKTAGISVSPTAKVSPTANAVNSHAGINTKPAEITANPAVTTTPATPVGGQQTVNPQSNPEQASVPSAPESGNGNSNSGAPGGDISI